MLKHIALAGVIALMLVTPCMATAHPLDFPFVVRHPSIGCPFDKLDAALKLERSGSKKELRNYMRTAGCSIIGPKDGLFRHTNTMALAGACRIIRWSENANPNEDAWVACDALGRPKGFTGIARASTKPQMPEKIRAYGVTTMLQVLMSGEPATLATTSKSNPPASIAGGLSAH